MLCPNCNNTLPDNSVACNFCGYSFQVAQPQNTHNEKQVVNASCIISMIINIVACMIIVISFFAPLYKANDAFNTLTGNVYESAYDITFYLLLFCIIILSFSFSFKNFIKQFAIIRLAISVMFFGIIVYTSNQIIAEFKEMIDMSTVQGNLNVNYGIGFYLMLAGIALCIVSAIINLATPTK